jgi:hypothetical protein
MLNAKHTPSEGRKLLLLPGPVTAWPVADYSGLSAATLGSLEGVNGLAKTHRRA